VIEQAAGAPTPPDVARESVADVGQPAGPAPRPDQDRGQAGPPRCEVWQLLGRADVIVRGCLESRDRAERRDWEERARAWLQDVDQAWIRSQRRSW
jgi:hypothetical protein